MAVNTIVLNWQDNSTDEDGFKIYKSTDGVTFNYLAAVGAGIITYTATGITEGQNYWFRVTAYNTDGESGYIQAGSLSCTWIPTAPSLLSSTCSTTAGSINLQWQDNSNNETGFKIYKSIDNITYSLLATVGAGVITYTATGIWQGQTTYFKVTAYNGAGESGYSGVTWTETQPAGAVDKDWWSAASSSDGTKLIVGENVGRLYTSTDSGATWTERQPAGNVDKIWYCAASSSDGTKLIVGVYIGRLYTSADSGATWTERQPAGNVDKYWETVASSSDGTKLIVGVIGGRLYTSTDSGATWTERQPAGNVDGNWRIAASSLDGTKLIVGVNGGRLYTSTDSGVTWTETQPAGNVDKNWVIAASSSDGTKLIVGEYIGRLYTSTDSGATWTERQPAGNVDKYWYSVASSSDGTKLVVGVEIGRLYTSADSGITWTETQPAGNVDKNWRSAASSSDGTKLIVGVDDVGRLYTGINNTASSQCLWGGESKGKALYRYLFGSDRKKKKVISERIPMPNYKSYV